MFYQLIVVTMCLYCKDMSSILFCNRVLSSNWFRAPFKNNMALYGIPPYTPLPSIPDFQPHNISLLDNSTSVITIKKMNFDFYEEQDNWDSGELTWRDIIKKTTNVNILIKNENETYPDYKYYRDMNLFDR